MPLLQTLTTTSQELLRAPPVLGLGPAPQYHETRRDHFDESDRKTWSQAFYVNDTFWQPGSDAPVFLCVGGEGPALDGSVAVSSPHCNNAVEWLKERKAIFFAVEHRYYGCHNMSACPYSASDKEPLQWLSSRQALADLATFHAYAVKRWQLTPRNKWVSFGGSYPGMLAGWFRVKYPSLAHAAVASSAPVLAKVDMTEYNDIVASAYALGSVGGSVACREAIANGHAIIGEMLKNSTGRKELKTMFKLPGLEPLATAAQRRSFAGDGVASFPAQSNDPACTEAGCNIARICEVMERGGDDVARLASLRHLQQAPSAQVVEAEEQTSAATAAAAAATAATAAAARRELAVASPHTVLDYWGYQTCKEFAFYQTCEEGTHCFFTQGLVTLNSSFLGVCAPLFGISPAAVAEHVRQTNAYYGGARPDLLSPPATRILYPNGDVDPWHGLSVLTAPTPQLPVLMVAGASHHAWTHPSLPTDQPSVVAARVAIRKQVAAWLDEEA